MRTTAITILLFLCLQTGPAAARAPSGKISSVVVHADRAQVTRAHAANCRSGKVEFAGLPSTLVMRSLRATAGGQGRVLGLTWRERATPYKVRVGALLQKIKVIEQQMVRVKHQAAMAAATVEKLQSFKGQLRRAWGHQAAGAAPPVKTWNAALDLLRAEALTAARKREAQRARMLELEQQMIRLKKEIGELEQSRRRTTLTVSVLVSCRGSVPVSLSYLVPGASWRVAYQIRASLAGKKVTLVAQAVVRQGTGEDWRGVDLAVSTVNLQRSNLPPRITGLEVRASEPVREQKVLERRVTSRRHLAVVSDVKLAATAARPAGPAVRLRAVASASVPGDGREVLVTLARASPTSRVALTAVPKLLPYVYHQLTAANPFPFTMLAGPVSIFRGDTFIGRARVQQTAPGEPVTLNLGLHNQVQVRRHVKTEKLAPATAFRSRRLVHRYRIQVDNWTRQPQTVTIQENMPVTRIKEIKVRLGKGTTRPTSTDTTAGLLTWVLTIPPRSKKFITLAYTVSVPKSYHIAGY